MVYTLNIVGQLNIPFRLGIAVLAPRRMFSDILGTDYTLFFQFCPKSALPWRGRHLIDRHPAAEKGCIRRAAVAPARGMVQEKSPHFGLLDLFDRGAGAAAAFLGTSRASMGGRKGARKRISACV